MLKITKLSIQDGGLSSFFLLKMNQLMNFDEKETDPKLMLSISTNHHHLQLNSANKQL